MIKRKTIIYTILCFALAAIFSNTALAQEANSSIVSCTYDTSIEAQNSASVVAIRRQLRVEPGEIFRVKVFLKNTGNTPWFSMDSSCAGPKMSLGTDNPRDRVSGLYPGTVDSDNNWKTVSRVYMDQERVDPGYVASFTFWAKAGSKEDVFKEFFTPVLEGVEWLDNSKFSFEVLIGHTGDSPKILRKKLEYSNQSGSVAKLDLNAEKKLLVDISEQKLKIYLGDHMVKEVPVSTGKSATPTPYGETKITLKQEVRVAHAYPHYIMPKFMMFRAGGYGFHALPSLGNDGGWFWTEARNHIGIPVSHGCIRLLPEDADYLFDFTDIGTRVVVQP